MNEPLRPCSSLDNGGAAHLDHLRVLPPVSVKCVVVIGGISVEVVEITWALRLARRWRPQTDAEAMIGMPAEVVSTCRPTGQVRANGELWEATCAEVRSSAT